MADKYAIPPGDLVLHKGQVLGTGGSGQVYKGTLRDKSGKRTVAVKVLEGSTATALPPHELLLLKKALEKCLYVCRPLGYCVKDGQVCMVLHLYEKSLKKYIEERSGRKKLHLREIVAIAKQLAEAVRMLHKNARIAHFDIKPDNVLLDASGNCYLCDFSIAHEIPVNASSVPLPHDAYGSTNYMSPEQVVNKPGGIGFAADSWGLAATILELATGSPPYTDLPVMRVLNMLMSGTGPTVPASLEPRLAHILSRSFVVSPATRQDVLAMRHALSSLNEVLRIESGGTSSVPTSVLHSADILPAPSTASAHSSLTAASPTPSVAAPVHPTSPSLSAPPGAGLPRVTPRNSNPANAVPGSAAATTSSAPTNTVSTSAGAAHRRSAPPETQSTPAPAEVDLLALDNLSVSPPVTGVNGAAAATNGAAPAPPATTAGPPAPPSHAPPASNGQAEPVVITAGANGCLGVKALFRSCTRLLVNPNDSRQMTGVVPVQRAGSPGLRECVSVSADGKLTWWDLCQGRVSGMSSLAAAAVPPGVVGRSVTANERFVTVGTDRAALLVWQFPNGGTSWIDANEGRAAADQVPPQCVAVTHVSSDIGRPAATSSESNRMYDLALQPRWAEDAGGRWVAAASSLGNLVLWDTATWQEIFCAKATAGSIYSCNALPGSNMVAVACPSPQLVQLWDCRQAPNSIAAVMTCDLPPRGAGPGHDDADVIYCVSHVPAAPGPAGLPSQLLLGSKRGRLYLWDVRAAGVLWTVAQLADKVLGCAASPCGRRVVAGSRSGQVAMLDWTQPLKGVQATQAAHPYVSQWKSSNSMYLWPRLEKGILRVACGNLLPGPLMADTSPAAAAAAAAAAAEHPPA